jgi:hypothetical protein
MGNTTLSTGSIFTVDVEQTSCRAGQVAKEHDLALPFLSYREIFASGKSYVKKNQISHYESIV